jgi:imidazolonepropionase-like amidohydrolase
VTRVVFRGGSIWDGSGADPAMGDLVVEDGRVVDVGRDLDGDEAIDVAGRTILPGLFDCHVHVGVAQPDTWKLAHQPVSYRILEAAGSLARTLDAGITSVRDAGGADLGIKQARDEGLVRGPRLQLSLRMISQTGGHGDDWLPSGILVDLFSRMPGLPETRADGPDEMRRVVRTLIRQGADVIKVATSGGVLSPRDKPTHAHFRPAELEVLVEEATAAGIHVMAHAQATDGIKNAIRAGIRSIEHGIFLDDEGIELMLQRGTWFVPTLVAPQGVIDAAEAGADFGPGILDKARAVVDVHREAFRRAVEAGVRIAMGTDSGITPHGANLRELALMQAGGMSPAAVLEATTRSAAQLLGVADRLGTLEPGKVADLVIVSGDPYDLASLSDRIESVWQDGTRVDGRRAAD